MSKKVSVILSSVIVAAVVVFWFVFGASSPINQHSAIKATLSWARLNPIPAGAKDIRINSEGSPFTRTFTLSFAASEQEINQWLSQSEGTKGVHPVPQSDGGLLFDIVPGERANNATVLWSKSKDTVVVHASWS